jgi:hypothetical protein
MIDSSSNIILLNLGWGGVSKTIQCYNGMPTWVEALADEVTTLYVIVALLVNGGM